MKFRKKPIVIEAFPLQDKYKDDILKWTTKERPIVIVTRQDTLGFVSIRYAEITTLEGVMKATLGDFIIKGVDGEVYPCKPDIFEKTYEPVE